MVDLSLYFQWVPRNRDQDTHLDIGMMMQLKLSVGKIQVEPLMKVGVLMSVITHLPRPEVETRYQISVADFSVHVQWVPT